MIFFTTGSIGKNCIVFPPIGKNSAFKRHSIISGLESWSGVLEWSGVKIGVKFGVEVGFFLVFFFLGQ